MLAIGLIETKGLIGLVAATDAMVKAANVHIEKGQQFFLADNRLFLF